MTKFSRYLKRSRVPVVVALASLSFAAVQYLTSKERPGIQVDQTIDLGVSEGGSTIGFAIPIKNISGHPIKLSSFQSSCKCAVISSAETLLPAGNTHTLSGSLQAPKYQGVFTQTVLFRTSDKLLPIVKIKLKVLIRDSVIASPARTIFEPDVTVGTSREVAIKFADKSLTPLTAFEATSPVSFVHAKTSIQNGLSPKLTLVIVEEPPSGEIDFPIKLSLKASGKAITVDYYVGGLLRNAASSSPGFIVLSGGTTHELKVHPEKLLETCRIQFTDPLMEKYLSAEVDGSVIRYKHLPTHQVDSTRTGSLALVDKASGSFKLLIPVYFAPEASNGE